MSHLEPRTRSLLSSFRHSTPATAALAAALSFAGSGTQAASYFVEHDFAFTTDNWSSVAPKPANVGLVMWNTKAVANGVVQSNGGTEVLLDYDANLTHNSASSNDGSSASASTLALVRTASSGNPAWTRGWGPTANFTWGTTLAQGYAFAAPSPYRNPATAYASSEVNVELGGYLPWGDHGQVYWQPSVIFSSSNGSASDVAPWFHDPFSAVWKDPSSGASVKTDLIGIDAHWTRDDPRANLNWDAAHGTLQIQASQEAGFSLVLDPRFVDNPGRLDVNFDKNGVGSLSGSGRYDGVGYSFDASQNAFTIQLGAIALDYSLPVSTYELGLSGGSGVPSLAQYSAPIPEPGAWVLFAVGGLLLRCARRRREPDCACPQPRSICPPAH